MLPKKKPTIKARKVFSQKLPTTYFRAMNFVALLNENWGYSLN
jgi:hypothetical protein